VLDARDRTTHSARLAGQLPPGSHVLRAATDSAAVVRSRVGDAFTLQSAFVPFDSTRPVVTVPNVDLGASFTLLEPSYLYSVADFRFYRVQSTPTKTALPLPLAASGPSSGSFHTIRVP
jgi:hypothetical protein